MGGCCEFLSLIPVNKQAAVVASCPNLKGAGCGRTWTKHVESDAHIATNKEKQRLSKIMFAWASLQRWDYCDKMRIVNTLAEHFDVRLSLCRLIVNGWERRRMIKRVARRIEFCPRGQGRGRGW